MAGGLDVNQIDAVRGTDWSFWLNWIENFASVLPLVPFTAVLSELSSGTPQIAAGTDLGLNLLLTARGATSTGESMDIASFLAGAESGTDIFVTGHSLGGCLASVLAPTLTYQLGSAVSFKVYTFAAPSAGNEDFAGYFNRLFADSHSKTSTAFRIYNNLDIVPTSWAARDVARETVGRASINYGQWHGLTRPKERMGSAARHGLSAVQSCPSAPIAVMANALPNRPVPAVCALAFAQRGTGATGGLARAGRPC